MKLFHWLGKKKDKSIAWQDESQNLMAYRFQKESKALRYGAKLIVGASQTVLFYYKDEMTDKLTPGTYTLESNLFPSFTQNTPLSDAELYFLVTAPFKALPWETITPIAIRDSELGMVELNAHGSYDIQVVNVEKFMSEMVKTDAYVTKDEVGVKLSNLILSRFANIVTQSNIPVADLLVNYDDVASYMKEHITPSFHAYGLELVSFHIESISLPKEAEKNLTTKREPQQTSPVTKETQPIVNDTLQTSTPEATIQDTHLPLEDTKLQTEQSHTLQENHSIEETPISEPTPHTNEEKQPVEEKVETDASTTTQNSMGNFYVAHIDKPEGPYSIDEIIADIRNGIIEEDTLVWTEGMSDWSEANSLFFDYFKKS
jgi:membrane protease subunit (stomatin/prohibitin family)